MNSVLAISDRKENAEGVDLIWKYIFYQQQTQMTKLKV